MGTKWLLRCAQFEADLLADWASGLGGANRKPLHLEAVYSAEIKRRTMHRYHPQSDWESEGLSLLQKREIKGVFSCLF